MIKREFVSQDFVDSFKSELPNHHNFKSKVGKRYGQLEVVKYAWFKKEHCYFCKCDCGVYLVKRSSNLSNQTYRSCGCQINKSKRLTEQEMLSLVADKIVVKSSPNVKSLWTFRCEEHGEYSSVFQQAAYHKTGCPKCCEYGYRKTRPGSFYILSITLDDKLIGFKYGITNISVHDRLSQIQRNTDYKLDVVVELFSEDGEVPVLLENLTKILVGKRFLTKEQLPYGHTETIHPVLINKLINLIDIYKD